MSQDIKRIDIDPGPIEPFTDGDTVESQSGWIRNILFIGISLVIFIAIILLFVLGRNLIPLKNAGSYGNPSLSQCIPLEAGNIACGIPGTQNSFQECLPNPHTGSGCINLNGNQSYDSIITNQPCTVPCQGLVFEPDPIPFSSSGISEVTKTCVRKDNGQINHCINREYIEGRNGKVKLITKVYEEGDTIIERIVATSSFSIPVSPPSLPSSSPSYSSLSSSLSPDEIVTYEHTSECVISDNQSSIDAYKEGKMRKKGKDRPCRYRPDLDSGTRYDSDLIKILITNISVITLKGNDSFLSPSYTPNTNGQKAKLKDWKMTNDNQLHDVELMWLSSGVSDKIKRDHCSKDDIMLNSSILLQIAPRRIIQEGIIECQIMGLIETGNVGWICYTRRGSRLYLTWKQAKQGPNHHGIDSKDASLFRLNVEGRIIEGKEEGGEKSEGMKEKEERKGKMKDEEVKTITKVGLYTSSFENIYGFNYDGGNDISLNDVELITMDHSVDISSRYNRDRYNCNLFHHIHPI